MRRSATGTKGGEANLIDKFVVDLENQSGDGSCCTSRPAEVIGVRFLLSLPILNLHGQTQTQKCEPDKTTRGVMHAVLSNSWSSR